MQRTNTIHVKTEQRDTPEIHRLPKGEQRFQREYGLRIGRAVQRVRSRPRTTMAPRYFEFYCIAQLLRGKGAFWSFQNGTEVFDPGHAVIVCPRFVHCYGGFQAHFEEDTICFAGRIADDLARIGVIQNGLVEIGEARRLQPIIELASDPARDAQIAANIALQKLLIDLYLERRLIGTGHRIDTIRSLLADMQKQPHKWWTVEAMAEYCNLSQMHFRRLFHEHTGCNPKNYVDNVKIQQAIDKLAGHQNIAEIAFSLGYRDPFHFSKRFKQITGFSPGTYRRRSFSGM